MKANNYTQEPQNLNHDKSAYIYSTRFNQYIY